jgi:hypothetical protein
MTTPIGMVAPASLSGMSNPVSTGLLKIIFETSVAVESVQHEPLFNNEHLIEVVDLSKGHESIGNKLFVDVTGGTKDARTIVLPFLRAIADSSIDGNATAYIGQESNLRMKYLKVYANDWGRPISSFGYGIDARELNDAYKVYDKIAPLLWQWKGEYQGYCARRAACQNISANLTAAPVSLTSGVNSHVWFPVLADSAQPSYNVTFQTYEDSLGLAAISAGASRTTNQLTVSALMDAAEYARKAYIMPVEMAGKKRYMVTLSPKQIVAMKKTTTTDGIAKIWVTSGTDFQNVANMIPDVEAVLGDVVIVGDNRAPTFHNVGYGSDYIPTFGYMQMGRTDGRVTALTSDDFDVNILWGERALIKYEPQQAMFKEQNDDYDRDHGDLIVGAMGYMTPAYDVDSAATATNQQEGCMLMLTSRV